MSRNHIVPQEIITIQGRNQRKHRTSALSAAMLMLLIFAMTTLCAKAQVPLDSPSTQSTTQSADDANTSTEPASASSEDSETESSAKPDDSSMQAVSLSSEQIIDLLQQNPDLMVELKYMAADRMQQQGVLVDANSISDESLYDQIASNASLRASITTFLRARGYITQDDLQAARFAASGPSADGTMSAAQRAAGMSDQASTSTLSAGPGTYTTQGIANGSTLSPSLSQQLGSINASQSVAKQRNEHANSSTDLPKVLHQPAPYNLRSMRDLYTQIPDQNARLKRFGSDVFINRTSAAVGRGVSGRDTPLDVPLGPDYVIGPGDTLSINMWGGVTQDITRIVDRDGRVLLPEAGSLEVGGLTLGRAQDLIGASLKQQFRNAQVVVTVSHLRSVRVYVVGDVQRPGGYDISSLATPLSALYAAGGPTAVGSLRTLRHYRGKQLIEEVDLYDFLLNGIRNGSARFEGGDTLLVPPAGPQVAVFGAVKRPAIYELKAGDTTLETVLNNAGGVTAAASLGHITIDRIDANRERETTTFKVAGEESTEADRQAISTFVVKDGDRIRVDPVLPYSERAVYLEGHVVRPGKMPYSDGMRLSDVLHSYRDMLPEPAAHGEIVRLVSPDLHAETIEFSVPDVLIGNTNVSLLPFDTIRIFGRYEVDAPKVTISGEVMRPGSYPLSTGMTAAQLVRMAGGFKRDAMQQNADLTSYQVVDGNRIVSDLTTVRIGAAVAGTDSSADALLKPGDILTIHQFTGWGNIGQSITIQGQVRFPGNYGFQEGERLSSVLRRAGGLLPTAYPMGAILVRDEVRDIEQKSREELIRQIETNSTAARLSPNLGAGTTGETLQLIKAQQDEVLSDLKSHPPTGRMVIHISADIDSWANTPADVEVRRGDVLTIPKRPGFVVVTGQVYNSIALTYTLGKTAGWYLSHAGGTNSTANRKEIFIILANGSVIGRHSGGWRDGSVLSTKLNPGDVVVVPQKVIGSSLFWRNLLTAGQLASSIAITTAVAAL
jgi:protein involved in polysaccharide export with SLBB domain